MKAFLEYDTDEPSDQMALLRAVKSVELCLVIFDIAELLRTNGKYTDPKTPDQLKDDYYEILRGHNIDLNEMIE